MVGGGGDCYGCIIIILQRGPGNLDTMAKRSVAAVVGESTKISLLPWSFAVLAGLCLCANVNPFLTTASEVAPWARTAAASFLLWVLVDVVFGTSTFFTNELSGLLHSLACSVLIGATTVADFTSGRDIYCFCSCAISPPWTASLIPSVSLGYGVYDLLVGIFRLKRFDYSLHGVVLIFGCGAVCYSHQGHHVAYAMFMEWSTVFLNLRALNSLWIDFIFVVLFFIMRVGVVPYVWTMWIYRYAQGDTDTSCIPGIVAYAALLGGLILHALNIYWARLVLKKFASVYVNSQRKADTSEGRDHRE